MHTSLTHTSGLQRALRVVRRLLDGCRAINEMVFALLFGIAFHFLYEEGRCIAGIDFAARAILLFLACLWLSSALGALLTPLMLDAWPLAPASAEVEAGGVVGLDRGLDRLDHRRRLDRRGLLRHG